MTTAVYRGRKTTIHQQQQEPILFLTTTKPINFIIYWHISFINMFKFLELIGADIR